MQPVARHIPDETVAPLKILKRRSSETTLWNTTIPNRLILITCLPNPRGGTAKDNIVITARQTSN